jgi:hypothetical protein
MRVGWRMTFKEWWKAHMWDEGLMEGGKSYYFSAYRAGQSEMRERAAMETWEWDDRDEIRKEIRALPLEGDDE